MTEDEKQLELPFNTGERKPPRAADKRVWQVRSAVRALRAAKIRREGPNLTDDDQGDVTSDQNQQRPSR